MPDMAAEHITLSLPAMLALLRRRGVEPHPVFAATVSWHGEETSRRLDDEADEELRRRTLMDGGRLHHGVESALCALDRPRREYYGWIHTTLDGSPRDYAVIAAQTDEHAVVAVHDHANAMVVLASVRGEDLTDGFASQIPPHHTARAASVNAPYQEFTAASTQSQNPGVRALKRLFAAPRVGAGNLYCAVRTSGGRKRIEHPVNYIDTPDGRWLTLLGGSGSQQWATATPATPDLIIRRLAEAASALTGTPGYSYGR